MYYYHICIYKNAEENTYREYQLTNINDVNDRLYNILTDEYDCSEEDAIDVCSWLELATVGDTYDANEFTIIVMEE